MIFMIDDDEDSLAIYSMLIDRSGYLSELITFNSGVDALHSLREIHQTSSVFPHYILLDLNMPELGGIDFVEKYESLFYQQYPLTKIIILTSSVRECENEKILSYRSVSQLLSKPLSKKMLIELLSANTS